MVPSDRMFLNDAVTGWTWHRLQHRRRREDAKAAAAYDSHVRSSMERRVTMSLNLEQKQAVVAEVAKAVAGAQAIVMAENRGLPVAAMTAFAAAMREA